MKRIFGDIPRTVIVSVGVLACSGLLFLALNFTLIAVLRGAIEENTRLTQSIEQAKNRTSTAQADIKYVGANQAKYEELLKSDRLVPHTRRVAVLELQRVARAHGFTQLTYQFSDVGQNSVTAAASQPVTGAYRLSVEEIELAVGTPVDGAVYRFIADITDRFPGSAVVQEVTLQRAPSVTSDALNAVSSGADSGLVKGEIKMVWRTAQANEKAGEGAK